MSVLDIDDLTVEYETETGNLRAVDSVDLSVKDGEILGIVGESGCGKTTLTKSIVGILHENGHVAGGEIRYNGRDISGLSEEGYRDVRWKEVSYIIQNAMNALDPVVRIGSQFVEIIQAHTDLSKKEARERTSEILNSVGIESNRIRDYPHELSGGQRQRAVIALALVLEPPLVIADEPTTGLDVVIQEQVLRLIQSIQRDLDNSMVLITHDISVVAEIADRIAVMYGGKIVEVGDVGDVFNRSGHPYTMGLMNAFPDVDDESDELVTIPGSPPDLVMPPDGCRFVDRCPFSTQECAQDPPLEQLSNGHAAKCHYTERAAEFRDRSRDSETWEKVTE